MRSFDSLCPSSVCEWNSSVPPVRDSEMSCCPAGLQTFSRGPDRLQGAGDDFVERNPAGYVSPEQAEQLPKVYVGRPIAMPEPPVTGDEDRRYCQYGSLLDFAQFKPRTRGNPPFGGTG